MQEEYLYQIIADELHLNIIQIRNTVEMLDDDNTVPFISRYRKERTGSLDEDQVRGIQEKIKYLRAVEARRETILRSISDQGKLTPELKKKIENTFKLQELEDFYLPYKPKKRTRATVAREKGLEPLAELIMSQETEQGEALILAARTYAAIGDRDFITPDDIKTMALAVLEHRLILRPEFEIEGLSVKEVIDDILKGIAVPR